MDSSRQQLALLLQSLPALRPAALSHLLRRFPSPQAFWAGSAPGDLPGAGPAVARAVAALQAAGPGAPAWATAQDWQALLQRDAITLISSDDEAYPALLREAPGHPAVLYVRGDLEALAIPQIAVVGSRHASRSGLSLAGDFAGELASLGLGICSGLALGIDGAAHRGALAAGGRSTAVLGTGLDRIYPSRHSPLAAELIERGALLSEFPPGTPPLPGHFPRRNRIIAGLCLGTLVVEAALRSGSLITARLALEFNREVFAVPGSVHNPQSRGTHALIRQGAKLVETVDHILEEVEALARFCIGTARKSSPAPEPLPDLEPQERRVLEAIDFYPMAMDQIARRTGLPVAEVAAALLTLELAGLVEARSGDYQRCR